MHKLTLAPYIKNDTKKNIYYQLYICNKLYIYYYIIDDSKICIHLYQNTSKIPGGQIICNISKNLTSIEIITIVGNFHSRTYYSHCDM